MTENENPFEVTAPAPQAIQPPVSMNAGTVKIEQTRAMSEVQGMMLLAKQFPRDETQAFMKALTACQRPDFAEKATYSYARGKETISGPSIRLAEELARCWGNIDFGIKELSQKDGESEMMTYAWDLETNTRSSQNFSVKHIRDTKNGAQKLTTQRDIYENNANNGGRRLRARILAILPPDLVNNAVAECKRTLAGKNDIPLIDRAKNMVMAFSKVGVKQALIEKRLGHSVENITPDELAEYKGILNSLKDGVSGISDWFDYSADGEKAAALNEILGTEVNKNVE